MELDKHYNSKETEDKIYQRWEDSGYFQPKINSTRTDNPNDGKSFTIIMPPINANGNLHAGHGLVMTIEDIMIRYKRMQGYKTLWLPGNDHAGFETQIVYEKKLEKEGRSRFDMEPKQLYDEIMDFTQNNRTNINSQIKKLGASCDWSREKFTLDDDIIKTVYSTFNKLYGDGLVYRGNRIINWCPKHRTSFSDLEIKDVEQKSSLYYLKYGPFVIATARPETKFGDKYIVMHPDDKRYKGYKDRQQIKLEWINGPITATIIKDNTIDMEFGTGAMTITPWHDSHDFEIAKRHELDKEQIINEQGLLLGIAGEFEGQHIKKARQTIIDKMQTKGLIDHVDENYTHTIRTCYKCGTTLEPQIKPQWFVKTKSLAQPVIERIEKDEVVFMPEHYKKIVLHWLNNIIDWNISRQIVWGIPIPAKLCDSCNEGFVDLDDSMTSCTKCGGSLRKDPDTFDTWFSSGQWPFVTLGYPDKDDFKTFYPTDVMETAAEIIFFWVSRMMMLGLYRTGKLPFHNVYLHGLVLDANGQKMSKSKGNVINPLELTNKYGTDAFRMALIVGNTPGTSLALAEDRIKGYKHFANKVWNAARFVISRINADQTQIDAEMISIDKQYLEELNILIDDITKDMDNYRFYIAAEKIYHYFWHTFADKIIEDCKTRINEYDNESSHEPKQARYRAKASAQYTLLTILKTTLKLLHPFMPFITEEIWSHLAKAVGNDVSQLSEHTQTDMLMIKSWPNAKDLGFRI